MASKGNINSVLKLQKLYCRVITNSPKCTSSDPLFKSLKILPLNKLYEYSILIFMFKFYHGYLPQSVKLFSKKPVLQNVNTRNEHFLVVPKCRTDIAKNFIVTFGPKLWNMHCAKIEFKCSIKTFKNNVRPLFLK